MVMKRAASNGRGQNVSAITALRAVSPFSEVHKPAEPARNPSLTNWMDLCDLARNNQPIKRIPPLT
jgi:hypothetical protein